jgi:signal transduction histidine kinase
MFNEQRILTVDDSPTIRVFLHNLLVGQGAQVEEASTAIDALALCETRRYDLILLDLMLPDMDGIQVLSTLRERDENTAIVVLTGVGGSKSAMTAVRQGADGYFEKQDLSISGDCSEFFYALQQACAHRSGLLAQKQLQTVRADFYSMVTHDLRNPTTTLLLALEALVGEGADPLTPAQREFLQMAQSAANKMLSLVNDYLDFAKIDAGYLQMDVVETDLREIARSSVRLASLQAQAYQHILSLDVPNCAVMAAVDAERMKQVLDNLVSNSIKYTPMGGQVSVSLSIQDAHAVLEVRDTGRGIPPEQLPALFTKNHRLPGEATRGIHGTGLGLLIVSEVIKAHGGTVEAYSEGVGTGSTFTVRLPLRKARDAEYGLPHDHQDMK